MITIVYISIYPQEIRPFQNTSDTLVTNKYDLLVDKFYENQSDISIATIYAKQYLNLAKKEKDTVKMMSGYYFFSVINDINVSLKYSDSILQITKNEVYNSKDYPAFAYLSKAMIYYNNGDFKNALDNFLRVNKESEKYKNTYLLFTSKNSIGILKGRLGENKTALKIFRESYIYFSSKKETYPENYLETLFALSDSYNRNKKLDSATIINKLGYKESLNMKNESMSVYFTLNEGVNQYHSGRYMVAKDSLRKSIKLLDDSQDSANLSIAHYYLGKTLLTLNSREKAIEEFVKVDNIVQEITEIMPETRDSYEILIDYYKENNDKDNQLIYIERLIKVDSIINSDYKYLSKKIIQNYDTPKLISDKEKIIKALEYEKKSSLKMNIIISLVCLTLTIVLGINYQKKRIYKKRFFKLYYENKNISSTTSNSIKKLPDNIGISKIVVDELLQKLDYFEKNKDFLKSKLTIGSLSKEFKTNSRYLSKTINVYKDKSFNNYINDLRINFVVEKLKNDSKFRKYTIKAIGHEVGFTSTEVFSKSFYKSTGVYPSYFLKQLEKKM
ncbi:helix-turn-helix domain-containing protein [Aquimarina algiphila]|uniref:helix-turn-helix domain-containing protein n=1 Tax=Aquimarina algiphila TaxID=2047982 RepID=UPI00232BEC98|nr:helix-turn-helix domain-containing protein [Aquimarina algiphila]